MPSYGLLTNPSNEILDEIANIHDLDFEYVEVGIEGPEGNPLIIEKKMISLIYFKNSRENQSAIPLIGLISAQILSMLEVHGFRKP